MLASGSGETPQPGRRIASRQGLNAALEIIGLWTLAILLPLLEIVGRDAPFLLHHRPDIIDLVIGVTALALAVPLLLVLLETIVGLLFGVAARDRAHLVVIATLLVIASLGMLRKLGDPLAPWALFPLVGAFLWLTLIVLRRWPALVGFFRILAVALPIVIVLFWDSAGARAARAAAATDAGRIYSDTADNAPPPTNDLPPVIWVIFDELPLLSIVDADLRIDRGLFPNLEAFADTATWYRNATTVWSSTSESVISMLTGTVAELQAPPTTDRYPDNLLTWLEPSHEIRALESVTSLSPPTAVDLLPRPPRTVRLSGFLSDAAIIAAHLVVPSELGGALPPIDNRWGGFASRRVVRARTGGEDAPERLTRWSFALADARADQFAGFLQSIGAGERPGLYFAHITLPHMPFRYLPSGRVYGGRPVNNSPSEAWLHDEWFALETYQRHLLQAGFVDRLVGDLVARLEETGLWEQAIVVLTSDHGVSHWPGEDRRLPRATDHPEDILRVPLFIKAPRQAAGRVDDGAARTIDALPTIAALLGRPLPWTTDGVELRAEREPASARVLRDPRGGVLSFDAALAPDRQSLARKLDLFDPQAGPWRWTRLGRYRDLVGAPVEELFVVAADSDCEAEIDQLSVVEEHDPSSRYSPAFLTGAIECARDLPVAPYVAVAVNGAVAGTAALRQVAGTQALYAVMTAEAAWRPGRNETELLLVSGPPAEPRIERIRTHPLRDD